MIFKSSFKGEGMAKYAVFAWIVKIAVWIAWFYFAVVPYGEKFITLLNESLNNSAWDLKTLLTPILYIFLWFVGLAIAESIVGFGIFFIAKAELKSRYPGSLF